MKTILKSLFKRLTWRHQWAEIHDVRTCAVCERCETLDLDPWGAGWVPMRKGDVAKHWEVK